jgi:cell division protein FtsW (lipid II flippase)
MRPTTLHLLLLAAPPVAASFVILALVGASKSLWLVQGFAVCLACLIAALGKQLSRTIRNPLVPAVVAMCITLVSLATTLMFGSSGPARWILFGPVNVYVAPVLLPSFLVAFWTLASKRGHHRLIALGAAIGVSVLLALQPDASQALALLAAVIVAVIGTRSTGLATAIALALIAVAMAWAFSRPDPLQPVPYVEGVFRLALAHSLFTGIAVIASAVALIAGLYRRSLNGHAFLSVVASYYAALFACSVAGLTPAPLIGYGAGPLLGYGLLVAMVSWVQPVGNPTK